MEIWIQNILIYVILSAVLRGLISNPSYLSFFQFTSGLILIMLLVSPLLSLLSPDGQWYENLEETVFQIDTGQIERELAVSEGEMEEIMMSEYEKEIDHQIRKIAQEQEREVTQTQVEWKEEGESRTIEEITVWVTSVEDEPESDSGSVAVMENSGTGKRDSMLAKRISRQYELEENNVTVIED